MLLNRQRKNGLGIIVHSEGRLICHYAKQENFQAIKLGFKCFYIFWADFHQQAAICLAEKEAGGRISV